MWKIWIRLVDIVFQLFQVAICHQETFHALILFISYYCILSELMMIKINSTRPSTSELQDSIEIETEIQLSHVLPIFNVKIKVNTFKIVDGHYKK